MSTQSQCIRLPFIFTGLEKFNVILQFVLVSVESMFQLFIYYCNAFMCLSLVLPQFSQLTGNNFTGS